MICRPFWRPVIAGQRGRVVVDPDAIHTYHYIPDVAAGLATLGTAGDDAYGRPWMLPCAPAETMRALVVRFSRELGREIRLRTTPRTVLKILALVVPFLREIDEMLYQWQEPFVISDRRFRERFGQGPEDVQRAGQNVRAAESTFRQPRSVDSGAIFRPLPGGEGHCRAALD